MQLTSAEFDALNSPLSNPARVLYMLGLRANADTQSGITAPLNYKHLITLLNSTEKVITLGRQINQLIEELVAASLVELDLEQLKTQSFNGVTVTLPLVKIKQDDYPALHMQFTQMTQNWQPYEPLLKDLIALVGIVDEAYSQTELGEFIVYWMGRPNMQFSLFQWTQKFVFHLKRNRLATTSKPVQKVGNQWVTPKAGVEADDNAKKLVEKYSKLNLDGETDQ